MYKIIILVGLCATVCFVGCSSKKQKKEEVSKYAITSPLTTDTSIIKEYVSQLQSVRNIEIRAQEKGYLQEIYVDEGQFVKYANTGSGKIEVHTWNSTYNGWVRHAATSHSSL